MYRICCVFLCLVGLLVVAVPRANADPNPTSSQVFDQRAIQLADYVERRATASSFADLVSFGNAAEQRGDREGLNRIYHVVWIYLNQGENEQAANWNQRLRRAAWAQHDQRYVAIAALNDLAQRYDMGDAAAMDLVLPYLSADQDWFVRVHAARLRGIQLMDSGHIGDGLKLLSEIQTDIPANDPYTATARAGVWEIVGMGLKDIGDIQGAVRAFHRYEVEYSDPTYPRPDFDSLYNLSSMAVALGDTDAAERFYNAHHRLTARSDMRALSFYDAVLCAQVSVSAGRYRGVLRCLEGFDEELQSGTLLSRDALADRAVARARLGQASAARSDLRALRLQSDPSWPKSILDLVEAEILFTENRPAEAYRLLRQYQQASQIESARRFVAGVHQVAGDMQQQVTDRQEQLITSRGYSRLQTVALILAVLFVLSSIAVILWQRRQALQLKFERRRADAANRAKSEFLANMSHEIRTPLNGVVSMGDALSRRNLPAADLEMVELIRSSGQTLERLLTDILDTAKIESGQMTLELDSFDLQHTVSDVAMLWRAMAEAKGVDLVLDLDPDCRKWVVGDAVRLRQVLTNLVSNALKFTDQGTVALSVSPGEGDSVHFVVRDTGVGFDEEQKTRIFQRFQQADGSITRRFGGTGLGLAISDTLVMLMGGDLTCSSTPGVGSEFSFSLPLPTGQRPADKPSPEPPVTNLETRPLRILLADDHPANRKVVEVMLAVTSMELVEVEDGVQAVDAYKAEKFDLVLMDMQMPIMDGLTACRTIRTLEAASGMARVPILMLTANAMPEHIEQGRQAGADGHLAKPITMSSLMSGIASVLVNPERLQAA